MKEQNKKFIFVYKRNRKKNSVDGGLVSTISNNYEGVLWKLFGTGLTMVSENQHSLLKFFSSGVCLGLRGREA